MFSLVQDAIKTMGQPEEHQEPASVDETIPRSEINSISLMESFKDWWGSSSDLRSPASLVKELERIRAAKTTNRQIEFDLFRAILSDDVYIQPPTGGSSGDQHTYYGQLMDTQLDENFTIHELYLENNEPHEEETHLVIIHGYMAAMGYFIKNVEILLKAKPGVRLHLIDMPGFGNSSRPPFPIELLGDRELHSEQIEQVLNAERWFIDKIEEWRIKRELIRFDIIAHSMGAYLSCCYLMKYNTPDMVKKLMLVSPMGTESSCISLLNDRRHQYNHHKYGNDPFGELKNTQKDHEGDESEMIALWERLGKPKFPKNFVLENLWKYHMSPFQLLQKFGPLYLKLLSYWSFKRFANIKSNGESSGETSYDLVMKLHNYSYSIFNQYQGSGELAITKLINHEILPRLPLCDRGFCEFVVETGLDVDIIYGDKDWMNPRGGEYIHEKINRLSTERSRYVMIEEAGHHIYLDNPELFNRECLAFFLADMRHDRMTLEDKI